MNPKNIAFDLSSGGNRGKPEHDQQQQISSLLYSLGLHGAIVLKDLNPSIIGVRDIDSIVLVDE